MLDIKPIINCQMQQKAWDETWGTVNNRDLTTIYYETWLELNIEFGAVCGYVQENASI